MQGTLKLEDKSGPVIRCENDTLTCLKAAILPTDDYIESLVSDCGPYPARMEIAHLIWEDYQCEDSLFMERSRGRSGARIPWGITNECAGEIWIERTGWIVWICPDTTIRSYDAGIP